MNTVFFIAGFTLVMLLSCTALEALFPRRKNILPRSNRWVSNYVLGAITWWSTTLAVSFLLVALGSIVELENWGWFQSHPAPLWVSLGALMLLTQLLSWALHLCFHKVPFCWRFHAVHHLDTELDTSTAFRNHPFEALMQLPIVAPVILLIGAPAEAALFNQIFSVAITVFSHSNLRIPEPVERRLRWFIVTPDFHRNHHCAERKFTDSNYGQAIPWFDYLFRTISSRPFDEQTSMQLGLQYGRRPDDSKIARLIIYPFLSRASRERR